MIRLTERAAYGIKEILSANQTPSDQGVKLVPDGQGGVAMTIDSPADGDSVVDGGKRPLLIVDSALTDHLDGIVLDLTVTGQAGDETRFVFRREPATT